MAVVVTYSGSGIINLATGAVAMVAAYSFWALKSDYFGFTLGDPPGDCRHDRGGGPARRAERAARLQTTANVVAARQAGRLARDLVDPPSDGAAVVRFVGEADPQRLPDEHHPCVRHVDPGEQVLDGVDRGTHRRRAHLVVPLDPIWSGDAGGGGKRGVRHACRPVAEPVVDGQHGAGVGTGRRDGHRRRSTRASGFEHAGALRGAGVGRCAVRRVRVAVDRLPGRLRDRDRGVIDVVRVDAVVVPDRQGQPAAGSAGLAHLHTARPRARRCAARACRRAASWSRSASLRPLDRSGWRALLWCWRSSVSCCWWCCRSATGRH